MQFYAQIVLNKQYGQKDNLYCSWCICVLFFGCNVEKQQLNKIYVIVSIIIIISGNRIKMIRTTIFKQFSTHTKFCIIGGGTGGLNLSSHMLRAKINPKDIRIFDASEEHYYQPGWTMLGANLCSPQLTHRKMKAVIPESVYLTKKNVAKVDASKNTIETEGGQTFTYDHVIFASGLKYDYGKVKGALQALEDPNSNVGSIYWLKYAEKLGRLGNKLKSGKAIFTEPTPPIKCAGAPQKILYLWTDEWRKAKLPIEVEYIKAPGVMFGVPKYSEALTKVASKFNIKCTFQHNLVEIKGDTAVFQNLQTKQKVEKKFDFLHMIPPMSAHNYIKQSGLADGAGYLDVDKFTLRHTQHKNVWGIGDCTNTPNSKTAAAVFSQTQTLVANILSATRAPQESLPSKYEGYASCPLFVGDGKLMLAQFKYGGVVDETFFSNQQKPRRIFYFLKKYGFPHIYWHLVPRGLWGGRKGIKIDI